MVRSRNALGHQHPAVAFSLMELGTLAMEREQSGEALPLLQRALAIREASLGKSHDYVALAAAELAKAQKRARVE